MNQKTPKTRCFLCFSRYNDENDNKSWLQIYQKDPTQEPWHPPPANEFRDRNDPHFFLKKMGEPDEKLHQKKKHESLGENASVVSGYKINLNDF